MEPPASLPGCMLPAPLQNAPNLWKLLTWCLSVSHQVVNQYGRLDVLVNNAAIQVRAPTLPQPLLLHGIPWRRRHAMACSYA